MLRRKEQIKVTKLVLSHRKLIKNLQPMLGVTQDELIHRYQTICSRGRRAAKFNNQYKEVGKELDFIERNINSDGTITLKLYKFMYDPVHRNPNEQKRNIRHTSETTNGFEGNIYINAIKETYILTDRMEDVISNPDVYGDNYGRY